MAKCKALTGSAVKMLNRNKITSAVSPACDHTISVRSDAEFWQTDRLNEVIERQFGSQLEYSDVEVAVWWSV